MAESKVGNEYRCFLVFMCAVKCVGAVVRSAFWKVRNKSSERSFLHLGRINVLHYAD